MAAAPAALEQALTEGLIAPPSEGPPEDYNRPSPVDIAEAAAVAQGLPLEPKAPELSTHVAKHVFAAVGTASEVSVPPGQLLTPLGRWDGKSHFVAPGLPCTNEAPCSADEHEFERATRVLTAEELLQQARKIYPAG